MFATTSLDRSNQRVEWLFKTLFLMMTVLLIVPVVIILAVLLYKGGPTLSWAFLTTIPTDGMTAGGILPALIGTVWLVAVALVASVPVGVAAAVYLSEYAPDNWLTRVINLAIINLAGVPSIVHALFGLPGGHRVDPGVAPGGAPGVSRGLLEHGCHPLADHQADRAAQLHQRHPHGGDSGGVPDGG
jgi:hypothetical protein